MVLEAIRFGWEPLVPNEPPSAHLAILDQLLLPHQTVFMRVASCEAAHDAIKKMQVRGAPAIAIVAALALASQLSREINTDDLPKTAEGTQQLIDSRLDFLKTSRPTAVNLGDAVGKLKKIVKDATSMPNPTPDSVATEYIHAAERMLADDVSDNQAIGEHGAQWIERNTAAGLRRKDNPQQPLQVLTHCNTGLVSPLLRALCAMVALLIITKITCHRELWDCSRSHSLVAITQ
jgi:methylthioribose-1-phosphate isomerase